ncbi:epoxide hydrolase 4-like [Oratosquilla oratoria]|uniref:epoxide hydrolase 4-like n=1 Tax=Oratosquilla oratoria TaxID=337810 RepID=UPI003F75E2FA
MWVLEIILRLIMSMFSAMISFAALLQLCWRCWKEGMKILQTKDRPLPPSILTDPKWGVHNYLYLKGQGIRLHYVEKGNRENPMLLCLHGFPEFWFSWRHQLLEFSEKYWVVALDMRGYGDSEKPKALQNYKIDLLVEDIREFIEVQGKEKCILMAHDWGAVLAWRLVATHPHMFSQHISLNGPHPDAFMKHVRSCPSQILKSWYILFFQSPWVPELMLGLNDLEALSKAFRGIKNNVTAFPDDIIEAFKYNYGKKGAFTGPINYYRNIPVTPEPPLPKIKVPTAIIWGTDDLALEKGIAKRATEFVEDVQLKFVDGASHWVQQDEPAHVNKLIWEYLETFEK